MLGQFPAIPFDFVADSNARNTVFCSGVRMPTRAASTSRCWAVGETAPDSAPTDMASPVERLDSVWVAESGSNPTRGAFTDDSPLSQTGGLPEKAGRAFLPIFFVSRLSPQDLGTFGGVDENSRFRESVSGSREEHPSFGSSRTGSGEKLSDSLVNTPLRVTDPFPLGPYPESSNRGLGGG